MILLIKNKDAIYFTINGYHYDDNILDSILKGINPYSTSKRLIVHKQESFVWNLPIITYDLQFTGRGKKVAEGPALKVFESNNGMSIEELPIPHLSKRSKELIYYNKQTWFKLTCYNDLMNPSW